MPLSLVKSAKNSVAVLFAAAALTFPGIASAGIVVASSGPSAAKYPAGKKLPDTMRITLKSGDKVTILDKRGTKVLRGPDTFTVGEAIGPRRTSTFATLTRLRNSTRARTGAIRGEGGTGGEMLSPNMWYINVAKPGTMCILDVDAVRLWRANAEKRESFVLTAADGSSKAIAAFDPMATLAIWDVAKAPVANGSAYTVRKEGTSTQGTITFAVLPDMPADPEALGEALIEHGCMDQLDLLTASLGN